MNEIEIKTTNDKLKFVGDLIRRNNIEWVQCKTSDGKIIHIRESCIEYIIEKQIEKEQP